MELQTHQLNGLRYPLTFKRNDALLECLPVGVIAFPGNGIQANLTDKARKLGIPVWNLCKGA